jgi:hypothetical protein
MKFRISNFQNFDDFMNYDGLCMYAESSEV